MGKIDDLLSRVSEINQKINGLISQEKEIDDQESAELQKIKTLKKHIDASKQGETAEDIKKDFVEAIKLLETISEELNQTSKELDHITAEMIENSSEELAIIEGLANNNLELRDSSKIQELAESINHTEINASKILEETEEAEKESQKAQKEATALKNMDKILKKIESIEKPEKVLKNTVNLLEEAENRFSNIPEQIKNINSTNQQTVVKIKENINPERREFLKGAGAVTATALTGLSGCMSQKEIFYASDDQREVFENNEADPEMSPVDRSDKKGENIELTGRAREIEELYETADRMTQKALKIHSAHSSENLPDGDELKEMRNLFGEAAKKHEKAVIIAHELDNRKAVEMLEHLKKVNIVFEKAIQHLHEAWWSTHQGAHKDAEEHLEKYQQNFKKAANMKHISEYELKKTLI